MLFLKNKNDNFGRNFFSLWGRLVENCFCSLLPRGKFIFICNDEVKCNEEYVFCLWVCLFFIAGCSPKVTTEVVKSYPVTRAYDVRLFEAKDTLPPAAEVLGRASVEKGTESDAETMVKVETAKVGG